MKYLKSLMNKLNVREKALVVLTLFSFMVLFYNAYYIPKARQLKQAKVTVGNLTEDIKNIERQLIILKSDTPNRFTKKEKEITKQKGSSYNVGGSFSDLLDQFVKISKNNNVDVLGVVPLETVDNNGYAQLILELELESGFDNLVSFLSRLENADIAVNVIDVAFVFTRDNVIRSSLHVKTLVNI